MPPSTFTVCPVMKSLSGEARNSMAPTTSCGTWTRLSARRPAEDSRRRMVSSAGIFFRQRIAGRQAVDIDIIVADFARQGAGEADGGGFRRDVMDAPRAAGKYGAGGDVDDLAGFLRAHGRQHGAAAEKQAAQIDRHELIPFRRIDGFDAAAVHRHDGENRGVVDENIDAAEAIESLRGHFLGRVLVRHIDVLQGRSISPARRVVLLISCRGLSAAGLSISAMTTRAPAPAKPLQ